MTYKKYLRKDGTKTGWITCPEPTDREIKWVAPLHRCYATGEKLGEFVCISCRKLVNEDQCGEWNGPSFGGEFVAD